MQKICIAVTIHCVKAAQYYIYLNVDGAMHFINLFNFNPNSAEDSSDSN